MTRKFSWRVVAAGAALVLAVGIVAAAAQDFLSPSPMVQQPTTRQKPQPARAPAAPPQASPSQAAAGAAAVKPDISNTFGDWLLQCFSKPARMCQISQRRINPNNQALLIWVELTHSMTPKPVWQLAVMLPLGFRIAPTLGVRADDQLLLDLPIVTCVPAGCVHAAEMPAAGLDNLQKAQSFGTQITDLKGQTYAVNVTMRGFDDAYLKSALFLKGS